jgi:hypothetical protein
MCHKPTSSCHHPRTIVLTQTDAAFQFVFVQKPNRAAGRSAKRLARSHAMKVALEQKRQHQRESNDNFRILQPQDCKSRRNKKQTSSVIVQVPPTHNLDPFRTLAAETLRMQVLIRDCKIRPPA